MHQVQRSPIIFCALTTLTVLAGCGPKITTSKASPFTPTTNPSISTTGVFTPAAGTGPVTLHIDALVYQASDTIAVTVTNQNPQTIYFPDHLTNCTVILLLRQKVQPLASGSGPEGINPCESSPATQIHALGPGQRLVVRLVAPSGGWLTGLYRATLSYHTSLAAHPPVTISSPVFTIGPLVPQP